MLKENYDNNLIYRCNFHNNFVFNNILGNFITSSLIIYVINSNNPENIVNLFKIEENYKRDIF